MYEWQCQSHPNIPNRDRTNKVYKLIICGRSYLDYNFLPVQPIVLIHNLTDIYIAKQYVSNTNTYKPNQNDIYNVFVLNLDPYHNTNIYMVYVS